MSYLVYTMHRMKTYDYNDEGGYFKVLAFFWKMPTNKVPINVKL